MMHAAVTSVGGPIVGRISIVAGLSGSARRDKRVLSRKEAAFTIGVFNVGSNVGAIVTPLVVPRIAAAFGWRMAFIATGVLTLA